MRGIVGRLRGDQTAALSAEVAALREIVLDINHKVGEMSTTLMELNHDVRAGSPDALPLFLGYTERLRLDTDTAIGAVQVIERQLAILEGRLDAAAASDAAPAGQ